MPERVQETEKGQPVTCKEKEDVSAGEQKRFKKAF